MVIVSMGQNVLSTLRHINVPITTFIELRLVVPENLIFKPAISVSVSSGPRHIGAVAVIVALMPHTGASASWVVAMVVAG